MEYRVVTARHGNSFHVVHETGRIEAFGMTRRVATVLARALNDAPTGIQRAAQ